MKYNSVTIEKLRAKNIKFFVKLKKTSTEMYEDDLLSRTQVLLYKSIKVQIYSRDDWVKCYLDDINNEKLQGKSTSNFG